MDFIGRKIPRQQADKLSKRFAAFANRRNEVAIEFAVKKEFAILGIEAHDIGRQQIDGEIRRELRKVFVTVRRETGHPIARHDSPARTAFTASKCRGAADIGGFQSQEIYLERYNFASLGNA